MQQITRYPLQWPAGWHRMEARDRAEARFSTRGRSAYAQKLTVGDATERVLETLERMGVDAIDDCVISSNLQVKLDGFPKSKQSEPDDPGVCVYWTTGTGATRCMAIDRYDRAADNIAAIAATLEAMRSIERHGGAEILDRAFTGFVALPAPAQWWHVLGLKSATECTEEVLEARYRRLAKRRHPDHGGSNEMMAELNWARDEARAYLGVGT